MIAKCFSHVLCFYSPRHLLIVNYLNDVMLKRSVVASWDTRRRWPFLKAFRHSSPGNYMSHHELALLLSKFPGPHSWSHKAPDCLMFPILRDEINVQHWLKLFYHSFYQVWSRSSRRKRGRWAGKRNCQGNKKTITEIQGTTFQRASPAVWLQQHHVWHSSIAVQVACRLGKARQERQTEF